MTARAIVSLIVLCIAFGPATGAGGPRAMELDNEKRDASMPLTPEAPNLVDLDRPGPTQPMNRDLLSRGVKRCLEPDSTTNSSDLEGVEKVPLEEIAVDPTLLKEEFEDHASRKMPNSAKVQHHVDQQLPDFRGLVDHVTEQPSNFCETKGDAVHHEPDDPTLQMPEAPGEAAPKEMLFPAPQRSAAARRLRETGDIQAPGPLLRKFPESEDHATTRLP